MYRAVWWRVKGKFKDYENNRKRRRERNVFQGERALAAKEPARSPVDQSRLSPAISLHLSSQLLLTSFLTVLPNPHECRLEKQIKYSV